LECPLYIAGEQEINLFSFFCMWLSNFLSIVYWRDCPFSKCMLLSPLSVWCTQVDLFPCSLFCSSRLGFCVYVTTKLFSYHSFRWSLSNFLPVLPWLRSSPSPHLSPSSS
jgi:hypothetical protein